MSTNIDTNDPDAEDFTEPGVIEQRPGRRYALLGAASAFIAGLSSLTSTGTAYADCQGSPCCSLALCTQCYYQVNKNRYTCPAGYHKTYWTCTSSSGTWYCGECTKGANCYQGPYACSIWYR